MNKQEKALSQNTPESYKLLVNIIEHYAKNGNVKRANAYEIFGMITFIKTLAGGLVENPTGCATEFAKTFSIDMQREYMNCLQYMHESLIDGIMSSKKS